MDSCKSCKNNLFLRELGLANPREIDLATKVKAVLPEIDWQSEDKLCELCIQRIEQCFSVKNTILRNNGMEFVPSPVVTPITQTICCLDFEDIIEREREYEVAQTNEAVDTLIKELEVLTNRHKSSENSVVELNNFTNLTTLDNDDNEVFFNNKRGQTQEFTDTIKNNFIQGIISDNFINDYFMVKHLDSPLAVEQHKVKQQSTQNNETISNLDVIDEESLFIKKGGGDKQIKSDSNSSTSRINIPANSSNCNILETGCLQREYVNSNRNNKITILQNIRIDSTCSSDKILSSIERKESSNTIEGINIKNININNESLTNEDVSVDIDKDPTVFDDLEQEENVNEPLIVLNYMKNNGDFHTVHLALDKKSGVKDDEVRSYVECFNLENPYQNIEPGKSNIPVGKDANKQTSSKDQNKKRKMKFLCTKCFKAFCNGTKLVKHLINEHGCDERTAKPYECNYCKKRFTTLSNMSQHVPYHLDGALKCPICGKHCQSSKQLKVHKLEHDNVWNFKCSECSKTFMNACNLTKHIYKFHNDSSKWQHECDLCLRKFPTASSLDYHKRSVHNNNERYMCLICKKWFFYKSKLNDHIQIHSEQRAYSCEICGKLFKRKWYVQVHKKNVHIKVKNSDKNYVTYGCYVCHKSFKYTIQLKRHLDLHEGQFQPFHCKKCEARFKDMYNYVQHLKNEHKIKFVKNIRQRLHA